MILVTVRVTDEHYKTLLQIADGKGTEPRRLVEGLIVKALMPKRHRSKVTPEMVGRIRELHARFMSDLEIGRELRVSDKTVARCRARIGLPSHRAAGGELRRSA